MCLEEDKSIKGVKVRSFNIFVMALVMVLYLLLVISAITIRSKYVSIVTELNDYSDCVKAVSEFRDSSEYLSTQARLFVINQDPIYMKNYFYESEVLRRREISLQIVEMTHNNDAIDANLKLALKDSEVLQKAEYYAMRLICEVADFIDDIPDPIKKVKLSAEDYTMSADELETKAEKLLFSHSYLAAKQHIYDYTNKARAASVNLYLEEKNVSDSAMLKSLHTQLTVITVLAIVSIILFLFWIFYVLRPLNFHIEAILNNKLMKQKGSYELKYIAKAYNALCERNELKASFLKHKAEHDPLTGLINREGFIHIKEAFAGADEKVAYLIIDVDRFKQINDKYGHPIGDEVLKNISNLFMEQFRETDYVARIGGDEFAVLMTKFGPSPREIIKRKIEKLNHALQSVDNGLPPATLSVGVALSSAGYQPILEEQADKALYKVKNSGRSNCSFYKGEE